MIFFAVLFFVWVLYTVALGKFLFYLCDLPPAPLFDVESTGLCSAFVLALFGWIFFSVFIVSSILEKVG